MLQSAPRPEFEQAMLRLVVSLLIVTYMGWYLSREHVAAPNESTVVWFGFFFFATAAMIAIRIVAHPQTSIGRRIVGMLVDNAATTYSMILMGEGGALIIGVYLFVALGNGFRFGRAYLHASQALACMGFGVVLAVSPFWSQHTAIGLGFLITLGVVPLYAGVLAERINEARKRADEANLAKGRFLANVSHEMRTPLNGVIAMADLLQETKLSESQSEIVETLGTSAQLLLAQIEDVLDISKIEAGRVTIEQHPFDLGRLLSSTVKIMMPQARYKGLAVSLDLPSAIPKYFRGDDHHLRQVLLNLLANAVKFTEHGEILLRVALVNGNDHNVRLRFEVKDTGIGIPLEKQAIIFEAFAQADDSITRTHGGTGLGTTIARHLVTLMGGEIGVQSEVGVGSLFWFEVPVSAAEASECDFTGDLDSSTRLSASAAVFAGRGPAKVARIRGARVLVAEDNPTNQRVTQLILESGGHQATIVENGEAALDALDEGRFDIALFDLSMPILSGLQALKMYHFTTGKPIPVLILSANVTAEIVAECHAAGCAEFVPKPLRASSLLDAIEHHLSPDAPTAPPVPIRAVERPTLSVVDTPVVDSQVIEDLELLSPDATFVERLIIGFKGDAERIVSEIAAALDSRHYEQIKDIAHALKGGAGSVGAMQLMQFAARLEKTNHDALRQKSNALLEELNRTTKQAFVVLEQHLEQRQTRLPARRRD